MTILVTGGAGFIGSNFVLDWFLEPNAEPIINLDKLTYAGNLTNLKCLQQDPRHKFVHGDISNVSLISGLLQEHQVRAIINFAAETHVDRSIHSPKPFIETNIIGTYSLLEAAREHYSLMAEKQKQKFRFLHISTDEVYGSLDFKESSFTEAHAYQPNSPYSASKASSDHLVRAWHHTYGLPAITTNCSNNYGPYHFPEKLIPLVILNALDGKSLPIYGDGQQIRDWLYVKDHCAALRCVLESGKVGETYNIGGCNEKTNIEVVSLICALLDKLKPKSDATSYASQITYVADRPGHDRRYAIDASKIQSDLAWKPMETFETGILKTVNWYLENMDWVADIRSGAYHEWLKTQYDLPKANSA